MRKLTGLGLAGLLALAACPSHTLLSLADQQAIQTSHCGKTRFLKQSFFVGPFFTYDDRLFISERGFDERVLVESPGGDPILPEKPSGVLPMGSRVRIREIEFPTSSAISDRKLKSPRHFVWVSLELAGGETPKPYVLVLTQELRSPADFDSALGTVLLDKDPRADFASRLPEVLEAIDRKTLVKGMRADALMRSRGYPDKITREVIKGARVEHWLYTPSRKVVLRDDRVESWEGFGEPAVEPAPPPAAPSAPAEGGEG
ncbi:MAG: hypothetical protein JXR96_18680 [Deltaproteobacteria bacterium]|nr:hypothetical protein [Deltaproteobacteria bacterium]